MRIYSINVLDGKETIFRTIGLLPSDVKAITYDKEFKYKFIIVDLYSRRERKRRIDSQDEPAVFKRSYVYLGGEEIARKEEQFTLEDIEELKEELTCIIHMDGTKTYMPPVVPTTEDIVDAIHTSSYTMHVVKDEPQRWATFSIEPNAYDLKEKPKLNEYATKLFGVNLYGDVFFINENLVS